MRTNLPDSTGEQFQVLICLQPAHLDQVWAQSWGWGCSVVTCAERHTSLWTEVLPSARVLLVEWAVLFPVSFSISHGDTTLSSAGKLAHGSWSWNWWEKPVLAVSPWLPLSEVTPSSGAVFTWPPLLRSVLCLKAWAPHRTQLLARPPQVFCLAAEMAQERLTHFPVLRLFCTCRGTEGKTPVKYFERKICHLEGGMSPCPGSPEAAVSTVTCLKDTAVMSYGRRGTVEHCRWSIGHPAPLSLSGELL